MTNLVFHPFPKTKRFRDMTGLQFTRLTVLGLARIGCWFCLCQCGKIVTVYANHLRTGATTSCGCRNSEAAALRATTHGDTGASEYVAFQGAKARCNNPRNPAYKYYGGRGIEFRFTSYTAFIDHIGHKPTPKHTLDRKDTNGHYEIGNVRWVTQKAQVRNQRSNRRITIGGVTKCLGEWVDGSGLKYRTAHARLGYGWCPECALNPLVSKCPHH